MTEQKFVYVDVDYLKELEETAKKVDYYKGIIDGIMMCREEPQTHDICTNTHECVKDTHDKTSPNSSETPNNCEPQTNCGDLADRLAYERGVKHAWEVAQKVFCSTVTFYEAEDVAKQIDKDINVRSKDEPQTATLYDQIVEDIETRVKCANAKKIEDEPQTEDGIMPEVKAEVRFDENNKTLWIKTDTVENYDRVIIEDGSNWCRIFYEECGECAHNTPRSNDEPQTDCAWR